MTRAIAIIRSALTTTVSRDTTEMPQDDRVTQEEMLNLFGDLLRA